MKTDFENQQTREKISKYIKRARFFIVTLKIVQIEIKHWGLLRGKTNAISIVYLQIKKYWLYALVPKAFIFSSF